MFEYLATDVKTSYGDNGNRNRSRSRSRSFSGSFDEDVDRERKIGDVDADDAGERHVGTDLEDRSNSRPTGGCTAWNE